MKKLLALVLFGVALMSLAACSNAESEIKNQAPPATELVTISKEMIDIKSNEIYENALSTNTGSTVNIAEKKNKLNELNKVIEKKFYETNVIRCEYKGKTNGKEICFKCTYNITAHGDSYIWDIENIECTKYESDYKLDIKSHINKVMSKAALRANVKNGEIKCIVYSDTIAVKHDVENKVNELKTSFIKMFSKEKQGVYLNYDADEGIYYREAYKFVECFLDAITGDLPFEIDTMLSSRCKLDEDVEQTNKKQVYTNGYTYSIEKKSETEYVIGVTRSEKDYKVTLVIDN